MADATTRTGFRVELPAALMPINTGGQAVDPAPWNRWDGFSPMATLLAEFPAVVDPAPLPSWHDPGASLGQQRRRRLMSAHGQALTFRLARVSGQTQFLFFFFFYPGFRARVRKPKCPTAWPYPWLLAVPRPAPV